MYIYKTQAYYRGTEKVVPRQHFLILFQVDDDHYPNLYGVTRRVAMQQCGAWMTGRANIKGKWMTLSGDYGSDGLPVTVTRSELPADAVRLPDDVASAFWAGDGWNMAGSEAPVMREWALRTFFYCGMEAA
jgi:hypothetical protein